MADHEDYYPGEAPAAHKVSHQDGGTDEISVAGLSGVPAALATHALLPSIHHLRYTDVEAEAAIDNIFNSDGNATRDINFMTNRLLLVGEPVSVFDGDNKGSRDIAISHHADLPTVHQDAPQLILDHKGDTSAHHAKYTDAEARAVYSPLSIAPCSFFPSLDTYDWTLGTDCIYNRASLAAQNFLTGVNLPHGVTVTKFRMYGDRNDAASSLVAWLYRSDRAGGAVLMASIVADWIDGYNSKEDSTIASATIDNANYTYFVMVQINPNDSIWDCRLSGIKIDFTG